MNYDTFDANVTALDIQIANGYPVSVAHSGDVMPMLNANLQNEYANAMQLLRRD